MARRRGRLGQRGEGGSVTLETVLVMPLVFASMFAVTQGALVYHARAVAIAAAQEGARTAGGERAGTAAGVAAATAFVADAGGEDVLVGASVTGTRSATTATVTVTGTSLSVIPGWSPVIRQAASAPVERITR